MKIKKIISATVLTISAFLSVQTQAHDAENIFDSAGLLFSSENLNKNLDEGEYEFAKYHARFGSSFTDRWKFTVEQDSVASLSVFDIELGFDIPGLELASQAGSGTNFFNTAQIFDTQNMVFSVFDSQHNLLGSAHENETLDGLNFVAGQWYTLKVSGVIGGFFGSAYHGALDITPTPVPLGDSAPMLGSALALAALRFRKRLFRAA